MKSNEYGCRNCNKSRPKSIPYGAVRTKFWCRTCDRDLVSKVNKSRERQKSKQALKLEDLENAKF